MKFSPASRLRPCCCCAPLARGRPLGGWPGLTGMTGCLPKLRRDPDESRCSRCRERPGPPPSAIRHPATTRPSAPRATAQDTTSASVRLIYPGRSIRGSTFIRFMIIVLAPFIHISTHVEDAQFIGEFLAYRFGAILDCYFRETSPPLSGCRYPNRGNLPSTSLPEQHIPIRLLSEAGSSFPFAC